MRTGYTTSIFEVDAINIFNFVNFGAPDLSITSTAFGRVTGQANTPRVLQFGGASGVLAFRFTVGQMPSGTRGRPDGGVLRRLTTVVLQPAAGAACRDPSVYVHAHCVAVAEPHGPDLQT